MKLYGTFLTLVAGAAMGLAAQSPTSFIDGTWKLNAAKSDGGPRELPGVLTIRVTSNGLEFEGLQMADGVETRLKFRSDGTETVNQLAGGVEMRGKHRVKDGALHAEYRIIMPETEFTQTDKIVVSADGKTLTTEREVKTPQGSFQQKLVFDRQ